FRKTQVISVHLEQATFTKHQPILIMAGTPVMSSQNVRESQAELFEIRGWNTFLPEPPQPLREMAAWGFRHGRRLCWSRAQSQVHVILCHGRFSKLRQRLARL